MSTYIIAKKCFLFHRAIIKMELFIGSKGRKCLVIFIILPLEISKYIVPVPLTKKSLVCNLEPLLPNKFCISICIIPNFNLFILYHFY